VVGVQVGVDDMEDPHPRLVRGGQIGFEVANRVDHRAGLLAATAQQVGDGDRIGVKELAQDHREDSIRRPVGA